MNSLFSGIHPFSLLPDHQQFKLNDNCSIVDFSLGQRVLRPDELSPYVYILLEGNIRCIVNDWQTKEQITFNVKSSRQIFGWLSLLRAYPCEHVIASTNIKVLSIDAALFIDCLKYQEFADHFNSRFGETELYEVFGKFIERVPNGKSVTYESVFNDLSTSRLATKKIDQLDFTYLQSLDSRYAWLYYHPTTGLIHLTELNINLSQKYTELTNILTPLRIIGIPSRLVDGLDKVSADLDLASSKKLNTIPDLTDLGILQEDDQTVHTQFPLIRGQNNIEIALAICQMISLFYNIPFKRDVVKNVLDDFVQRDKAISLELLGNMTELLSMNCQIAKISAEYVSAIEPPAIVEYDNSFSVIYRINNKQVVLGDPRSKKIKTLDTSEFKEKSGSSIRFLIPRRTAASTTQNFSWSWFFPLLKKYKFPLAIVFLGSFLAQIFGLAIPLLIQQIIDKVLSQGNLSSLNVLGSAMIIMALFQGILQSLRTYIFVDTTDRMDLTLGSTVISRLLALPLKFFEKRSVGELSQRLGELNTLRGFLTGTAMISVLNLIFATLYLIVMFVYSPLLSVVALSTFPLYLLLVFSVAPIYKSLIRARAQASARTQSHLIEVISGIQTVKAQHFELTARWKWQDRYKIFVTEGFKSSVLGSTASEIGSFLNQLSGLLVLWVGMYLVLKGEFTLGQLIAFRIISGNVTSPLLQLSGLYQGFQKVQLSFERLGDILNQEPELTPISTTANITLPPIKGKVAFEEIFFRFNEKKGPYQLENVSIEIHQNSFVGVVGESGSGKSTLMKLLPKLYEPQQGRIRIDDYDISKVDLSSLRRQIGIVPQDSLLFEGTIAENICLNDPNATTESIINVAKISCAHDFIMDLEKGYATEISERGSNLSGGQRQRIAIARTLLTNPNLLVLDEATSALDYDTESRLCLNLQKWAINKTVFFITHRLATVKNADTIILMHKGKLDEFGTHDELISSRGRYFALYNQQN